LLLQLMHKRKECCTQWQGAASASPE